MRKSFPLVAATVALVIVAGCTPQSEAPRQNASRPKPAEQTRTLEPEAILDQQLAIDVATLTRRFGTPDTISRPSHDDPSPWGQWLQWKRAGGSILRALADDYSTRSTNQKATVRYLELRSNGASESTLHGFVFGMTTLSRVETTLPGTRATNVHMRRELGTTESYQHSSRYDSGDLHTYFFFDARGRLQGVAQATFLLEGAD